ncbi:tetratricopeptide repeat protein [Microbacterium immunditiarum]|uniref:Tetratricopeptide (TPR) repeat protein n=1 Tax=Microbacterium immunditiarum TaxID=337480 RepID=A0A7Y9GPD4_9MICO|nr:tetratricopeptide repeat protein [Microbacterium immunditiarum]NYE20218.1 tetratricopeptide (TPR) repeat protein [Microbacterium immunditiarum]
MIDDWDERIAAVWADETASDEEVIARIDALASERPDDDARALFERAGSRDSAGLEAEAEPLYRAALEAGLDDEHRPQAAIQLASTLRNLDRTDEAIRMLRAELDREPPSPLRDEAAAFLALALVSAGHEREGASVALRALAPHLSRYRRSVLAYVDEIDTGVR